VVDPAAVDPVVAAVTPGGTGAEEGCKAEARQAEAGQPSISPPLGCPLGKAPARPHAQAAVAAEEAFPGETELLALQLTNVQAGLRQHLVRLRSSMLTDESRALLMQRTHYRRSRKQALEEMRRTEREQREQKLQDEKERRQKHSDFLLALQAHHVDFRAHHKNKLQSVARNAKAIKMQFEAKDLALAREGDRTERARLKALKANDMEAYHKLVEETKNERLHFLLKQTDEYLKSIADLVKTHQEDAEEEAKTDAAEGDAPAKQEASAVGGEAVDGAGAMPAQTIFKSNAANEEVIERQPAMLKGGDLKAYQLQGLQWMVTLYNNNLNGILADEMGLGKTIQSIALIAYVMEMKKNNGPFLIVVPLSTLSNWANEFVKWAPDIGVVVYKGAPGVRKEIQREEMAGSQFNVLLTTFEFVMKDKAVLRKIKWQYIIVDEGHRMKNANSKFAQTLGSMYTSRHRLLLTGTPLQNNLPELWSLLNFLLPKIFNSVDNFEMWFNKPFANFGGGAAATQAQSAEMQQQMNEEERILIINRLHNVLRPFMMRRIKAQVRTDTCALIRRATWEGSQSADSRQSA
jgi:SNF2 family DNA or RNA helicase